jgi:hypothetical protein
VATREATLVDINPADAVSKYVPRESTIVDAVAEVKRVADQQMRSNPLKNAKVDEGLTRWVGNYGSDFAWFGEFFPADQNQLDAYGHARAQRGISFVRDQPGPQAAFALYDAWPKAGTALRQRLYMYDADGKKYMMEGYNGGRAYPDAPLVLYQRETIDPNGIVATTDTVVFSGEGNMTGTKVRMAAAWATAGGTPTYSTYLRVSGGGVTITTATTSGSGAGSVFWDIDTKTIMNVSDYVNVEWHMWKTGGTGGLMPRPYYCRTFSDLTPPAGA